MNNDGLTLNQLAERNAVLVSEVEKLRAERDQLAAENVGLKVVFSQGEIPDEAVDAFSDTVAIDSDWDESGTWSYVENETEVIRAVLDALRPETPATDRIVAGIKADAQSEVIEWLDAEITAIDTMYRGEPSYERDANWMKSEVLDVVELARKAFPAQLREGAK
ncbi:TPA: hypothetical protein VEQ20_000551 [Raoultella ornithinolytica]|uniref:hypothetical protein n=1 Tax=Raoultella planticola TaxID=575 RepID=UPI000D81DB51|nr:hypothetical protein [Raoultella planticola]SPZ32232.1 Uncharacterised protein [Raoultella planticola]HEQ2046434.1 hypothetical protein [Raoultella ornithinolytica]